MHNDESQPSARPPMGEVATHPGTKVPASTSARSAAMPGGVPPMFASPHVIPPGPGGEAVEH